MESTQTTLPATPACFPVHCVAMGQGTAQAGERIALPHGTVVVAIQQGGVQAVWEDVGIALPQGVVVVVTASNPCTLTATATGCTWRWVHLQGDVVDTIVQQMLLHGTPVFAQGAHCMQLAMGAMFAMQEGEMGMSPAQMSAAGYQLLALLYGKNGDLQAARYPQLVTDALQYMQQQLAHIYGVEDVATALGVSKAHLIRVFSACMGHTVGKHLTMLRIAHAKQLLASESLPLEVLAAASGFSSASYFCKVFRAETGLTPNEFRATCPKVVAPAEIYL